MVAKYLPNENIQIDVLLKTTRKKFGIFPIKHVIDDINVFLLPRKKFFMKRWLKKQKYDTYLSIETTFDLPMIYDPNPNKKLIFWIQDPRPWSDWEEINTVKLFPEPSYWNQELYNHIHNWYKEDRIKFISQGYFLNNKARELYRLDENTEITYLPNPIEIDYNFNIHTHIKKNIIIFLGRIESVKRGWLFCEIAKNCPEYEFYMLGQTSRDIEKNNETIKKYENIQNLHFVGHVDGEKKVKFLKDAKVLVNTSIHEALPISFLEALSYGTLLVSNQNPENLTEKFGVYTGKVLGDGFEDIYKYIEGIRFLIENDSHRLELANKGIKYIKEVHNLSKFKDNMNKIINEILND